MVVGLQYVVVGREKVFSPLYMNAMQYVDACSSLRQICVAGGEGCVSASAPRAGEGGGETLQDGGGERSTAREIHRPGGDQTGPAERSGQVQRGESLSVWQTCTNDPKPPF